MSAPTLIRWPAGSFVCFGQTVAPFLVVLTKGQHDGLRSMQELHIRRGHWEQKRPDVYASVFGAGVQAALPATSIECMEQIALEYVGPHQVDVRGMCAAIAMGRSVGKDGAAGSDKPAGEPAPLQPVKPKKPTPSASRPMNELFREYEQELASGIPR